MSFPEGEPRDIQETKRRGLMRLFPHFLQRKNWHIDVGNWLKTKEGGDDFDDIFQKFWATSLVGHMTGGDNEVREDMFWSEAIPIGRENHLFAIDEPDDKYLERMRESLKYSIKAGAILRHNGTLRLSETETLHFTLGRAVVEAQENVDSRQSPPEKL
jgi:hypothetical protein